MWYGDAGPCWWTIAGCSERARLYRDPDILGAEFMVLFGGVDSARM